MLICPLDQLEACIPLTIFKGKREYVFSKVEIISTKNPISSMQEKSGIIAG